MKSFAVSFYMEGWLTFITSGRGWVLNTSFMFADWSENLGIAGCMFEAG